MTNSATKLALSGIRVVCFGMGGAAPLGTAVLADFGADVIKVEPPGGDWSRTTPGLGTREFNRNKRGIAVDLKSDKGKAIAWKLLETADVVMESFRPGVIDRLGFGYEAVKAVKPDIVYCSVSAYGQTGPWRERPGVDGIIQAIAGIMSVVGDDDVNDDPIKVSFPVVDMTAGLLSAQGILVALLARDRHGIGQHVDLSLLEAALVIQKSSITRYMSSKELPPRTGSRAPYATPNEAFRTKDGFMMMAAYNVPRWHALCHHVLQRPELESDPRFATRQIRQKYYKELKAIIEEVFVTRTTAEWLDLCEKHDLMCAPINNYVDVVAHEQVVAREALTELTLPDGKVIGSVSVVPKLSETPGSIRTTFPATIGQDTRAVLRELGLAQAEIDDLVASGAVVAAGESA
jgi:crotonobetainyl-CoA:carnitine CoA-transferase CaiB-like acyl-CoA transferase